MARQPVYSTLFIDVGFTGDSAAYLVPDGYLAVVRDVCALFEGTPSNTAAAIRRGTTGGFLFYHSMTTENEFVHLDLRQVVEAGTEITATSVGPGVVVLSVCGYLLALP